MGKRYITDKQILTGVLDIVSNVRRRLASRLHCWCNLRRPHPSFNDYTGTPKNTHTGC